MLCYRSRSGEPHVREKDSHTLNMQNVSIGVGLYVSCKMIAPGIGGVALLAMVSSTSTSTSILMSIRLEAEAIRREESNSAKVIGSHSTKKRKMGG